MRRLAVILIGAVLLGFGVPSLAGGSALGVPSGTPVHVHTHPDNGVVTAVQIAARRVGLGPVEAVGFERNCVPNFGRVIVCRDTSLDRHGNPTSTSVGPNWCVVRLHPSVGAGASGVRAMIAAFRLCLTP